jgi:NAD-dependent deacetylase
MSLEEARGWLENASRVAVLTGAGISAESGVPTFRGAQGLWNQFRPEQLASRQAFDRDPELVWKWYDWRRGIIGGAEPNPGHRALAALERKVKLTVVTQNVDGLHQRAGSESVLEVHGSIWTLRCTECRREWRDHTVPIAMLPRCACGGLARPGVVWFGEALPDGVWAAAERATSSCDVFLVVGTSAVVYPAAGLVPLARASGAHVIEVNIEPTPMSSVVDCVLTGASGEILPQLFE